MPKTCSISQPNRVTHISSETVFCPCIFLYAKSIVAVQQCAIGTEKNSDDAQRHYQYVIQA